MKNLLYILLALVLVACSDTMLPDSNRNEDQEELSVPDMTGEVIRFVSVSQNGSSTRADLDEKYEVDNFEYVGKKSSDEFYDFKIAMYKESDANKIADAKYDIQEKEDITKADGTLTPSFQDANVPLYWPDNVNSYGFMVTACDNDEVALYQDDPVTLDETSDDISKHSGYNFWTNDKLIGYSYMPGRFDDLDNINFRSNKKWYLHNKYRWAEKKQTSESEDEYKKVPLYMKHQRAWITIVLKAGQGVERRSLAYANTKNSLKGSVIYSKNKNAADATDEFNEITPWRVPGTVEYSEENGLPYDMTENNTTVLHAIVEPHDYRGGSAKVEDMIGKIKLSGMTFNYSPSNDGDATGHMELYNLTAGKHLIITASLTTEKIVLISARIEDWEEVTFGSVCDDYGYNGDPIIIQSRDELLAFLQDQELNKAGNIALISAPTLDLEKSTLADDKVIADVLKADYNPGTVKDDPWVPQELELKCALNLAGCKISSKGQFLTNISENGSLINGTINITGDRSASSARMTGAVCNENRGIIDHINITVEDDMTYKNYYATRGSICNINYGEILYCQSDLQVKSEAGYTGFVGGIAGESKQWTWTDNSDTNEPITKYGTLPIIDHCTMNGRAGTTDNNFKGCAGIVGYAENRVTYNTFNYGMTLSQVSGAVGDEGNSHTYVYANIVAETRNIEDNLCVDAYGNSWPTTAINEIGKNATDKNTNANTAVKYDNVVDCQSELQQLITSYSGNGNNTKKFRIANDFVINSEWTHGVSAKSDASSELAFELDGNDKTITTNGKMIFSNITGYFHDFTIECAEDLIAQKTGTDGDYDNTESIAPLAYSVHVSHGSKGQLENIKVITNDKIIQAPIPAGLVVWAYENANITDCKVAAKLSVKFSEGYNDTDGTKLAGGIAALSNIATFSGCHFYGSIETTYSGNSSKKYRGGIVGGVAISDTDGISGNPKTVIKDCASWWGEEMPEEDNVNWSPAGAIIGMTKFSLGSSNTNLENGIDGENSAGNWWGIGNAAGNLTEAEAVQVLGKKNGIQPQREM